MRYRNMPARRAVPNRYLGTEGQRAAVYAAMLAYAARHGGATPTLREIMRATGLGSTSAAAHHVHILIEMGRLEVRDNKLLIAGGVWTPPEEDAS